MQIVIDIPEDRYNEIYSLKFVMYGLQSEENKQLFYRLINAVRDGTPLPKGHGRIVDIGKIDEDRIDKDNPMIYLIENGEYIEAVRLDYLNNLSTIIEAEKEE